MIHAPADENPHQGYHSMLLGACEEYRAKLDKLERENAALKQRILDDNKAYGCELRDPSGTIWDHAKRLQDENAALRADKERLDWLDRRCGWLTYVKNAEGGPWRARCELGQDVVGFGENARSAIDAARKQKTT